MGAICKAFAASRKGSAGHIGAIRAEHDYIKHSSAKLDSRQASIAFVNVDTRPVHALSRVSGFRSDTMPPDDVRKYDTI